MSETEAFRLAVQLVILDIEDVLDAVDAGGVDTRRGVLVLFESQLQVLKEVARDLETKPLSQRIRALTQSTVSVLPPLLNSVDKSTRDSPLPAVSKCRQAIDSLVGHLW